MVSPVFPPVAIPVVPCSLPLPFPLNFEVPGKVLHVSQNSKISLMYSLLSRFFLTRMAMLFGALLPSVRSAPTHFIDEKPVAVSQVAPGTYLVDFGRVAFSNVRLLQPKGSSARIGVHFGEAQTAEGRVDRSPPGTVRYHRTSVMLDGSGEFVVAPPPADVRNTWQPDKMDFAEWSKTPGTPRQPPPPSILTPEEWGVVLPFRWVEIEGWPGELRAEDIVRQSGYSSTWDDDAAAFISDDDLLNRIWELCRYSIKATTFAGVYVDGDRERIPYEADAYLNQLSHYATDFDVEMARDTFDHLMIHGTWPTEWASHMVFMAYTDWWQTGDNAWLETRYDALRDKLLLERVAEDGLVHSTEALIKQGDIVDWPKGERDGFVFTERNAVVNAFYLRALEMMVDMGRALGRDEAAAEYEGLHQRGKNAFAKTFFDAAGGLCRDGVGTEHSSLHANLFASLFGLVPASHEATVNAWLQTRDMDCSVYVAQYYMEALFGAGAGERALELILAPNDRSWRHMVESGTTITWEAWDLKYKGNQDWNHAWGAAPANLLPRFVLGVRPTEPGWATAIIAPQPSGLGQAKGRVPTPRGAIEVNWTTGEKFRLHVEVPVAIAATVMLPAQPGETGVRCDGKIVSAERRGGAWHVISPVTGPAQFETF